MIAQVFRQICLMGVQSALSCCLERCSILFIQHRDQLPDSVFHRFLMKEDTLTSINRIQLDERLYYVVFNWTTFVLLVSWTSATYNGSSVYDTLFTRNATPVLFVYLNNIEYMAYFFFDIDEQQKNWVTNIKRININDFFTLLDKRLNIF